MSAPSHEALTRQQTQFHGRLVCVGFGSIGQGVLPLILRHIGALLPSRITIVTADDTGRAVAEKFGVRFVVQPLTLENYRSVRDPLVGVGDFRPTYGRFAINKWNIQEQ